MKRKGGIKRIKRALCYVTVVIILLNSLPLSFYGVFSDVISELGFSYLEAKAAEYDVNNYSGTTLNLSQTEFAEYSRCYKNDTNFAASHQWDNITVNPAGVWILDSDYEPLGTQDYPFGGTIYISAYNEEGILIAANRPIFDYVYDSVNIFKTDTTDPFTLEFVRTEDVQSGSSSPLFANYVCNDPTKEENAVGWSVKLSNAEANGKNNLYSFSGVIGEILTGSEVKLDFINACSTRADIGATGIEMGARVTSGKDGTGILCGIINGNASLTASYQDITDGTKPFFVSAQNSVGGLVGKMLTDLNTNDGPTFQLTLASNLNIALQTTGGSNPRTGLICGYAKGDTAKTAKIKLPDGMTIKGSMSNARDAGGLVGGLDEGDIIIGNDGAGRVNLQNMNISGSGCTGGAIGWFGSSNNLNKALSTAEYSFSNCTLSGGSGGSVGGVVGKYEAKGIDITTINVSNYTFDESCSISGGSVGGGVIGYYVPSCNNTTVTGMFTPLKSSIGFGGVIGKYTSSSDSSKADLSKTLSINSLIVNNLDCTGNVTVGGVIQTVINSSYISVSDVKIYKAKGNQSLFGGIIGTLDNNRNTGSFLDLTGNVTVSTNGSYNGGAIAGSFKKGVIRFAGTTDISGASPSVGYAHLVYENDNTLIYAKGSGSDQNWTLVRNTVADSDLGMWGEVVRLVDDNKNIEDAEIVRVNGHTVTLQSAVSNITDKTTFAKAALNMQLNDETGNGFGALQFAANENLCNDNITIDGVIDLSGTGLLGLMRDGGNGKKYNVSNEIAKSAYNDGFSYFFTGTITGRNNATVNLNIGETYGTYSDSNLEDVYKVGGKIYLSNNSGHNCLGLLSFTKGATISNIKLTGNIEAIRQNAGDQLYVGSVAGFMTNGMIVEGVTVSTNIDTYKNNENGKFYIGGLVGLFDGIESSDAYYSLSISNCIISPTITLHGKYGAYSEDNYNNKNIYAGGVLGLLGGKSETKYAVSVDGCSVNPKICLGEDVDKTNDSYVGGFIGRIRENTINERNVVIKNTNMIEASVTLKSLYSGGLLGCMWDRTNLEIDNLTITGSTVENKRESSPKLSGLIYRGTGFWNVKQLSITNYTKFTSSSAAESFGLIVNEAYHGNDGLYISLQNNGYTLENVTVPIASFGDEIAAKTAKDVNNVLTGGSGTGVVSINMNTTDSTRTNIADLKDADGNVTIEGTGTYQNKITTTNYNKYNNCSRYYYNLDVISDKMESDKKTGNTTVTGGEKFLAWSVYTYAAENIKKYFNGNDDKIGSLANDKADLSGLSYYPIDIVSVTLPKAVYSMDFNGVKSAEEKNNTDSYFRNPDDATNKNQHYLMQTGLFHNLTGSLKTDGEITLAGNYGYVKDVMNGVLVGNVSTGTIDLTKGITLDGLKPSNTSVAMLINKIDGSGTNTPKLKITKLRAEGYPSVDTSAVASALVDTASGTNMEIIFKDIKLDARNGDTSDLTSKDSEAMNTAYGTSRSIFGTATFFNKLSTDSSSTVEYYYSWNEDWGDADKDGVADRNVTYAKEITNTAIYKDEEDHTKSGENRYSGSDRRYTNPRNAYELDDAFDFSKGFLPHVGAKANDDTTTYPIYEVKVNYQLAGLEEGCGTYNDPYIINSGLLLKKVAAYINSDSGMLDTVRLPNVVNATWHDAKEGDSLYKKEGDNYTKKDDSDTKALDSGKWNKANVRKYLAGAYYQISGHIELAADFPSISIGGTNENGENIFHGVIVGKQTMNEQGEMVNPVITNLSGNPLIKISNGAVIKNVDIEVKSNSDTGSISKTITDKNNTMSNKRFGYGRVSQEAAQYYGGVIGEIMGGDNVIDNVKVTYQNTTINLDGNYGNTVPVGGYVGVIVNGGLFFRNMPDLSRDNATGLNVKNGEINLMADTANRALYVNPIVGRVINGYAVNENTDKINNGTKHYTIDNISKPTDPEGKDKLQVTLSNATINVPNAQALFVLSLITQSTAGVADSSSGSYNGKCFSYGMANSNAYLVGVTHQGDYSSVGAVDTNEAIITNPPEDGDYSTKAKNDTALAKLNSNGSYNYDARNTAVPYLIQNYTSGADARCVTKDKNTYYTITLTDSHYDLSGFKSFRGIGCVGNANALYNMKLNTFEGNNHTITINTKLTRYGNDKDNYFYGCIRSTDPTDYSRDIKTEFKGDDSNSDLPLYSHGIGLFDHVTSKDENNRSIFQNFILKGYVQDLVYSADDDTLKNNSEGKYAERFSAGGVLGFGYNKTYHTFTNITLDDLTVKCAYSSGGIIGLLANNQVDKVGIDIKKCKTGDTGITIVGGYHANKNEARQGSGGLIGMNMKSKTTINQSLEENEKDIIYTVKIRQVTNDCPKGDNNLSRDNNGKAQRSNAGGIIGYGGVGVKISNMKVVGVGDQPAIGDLEQTSNAAGIVAYAQNKSETGKDSDITLTNCSVENISILANTNAGGLFSKSWEDGWAPSFCHFINCHVSGELKEDNTIQYRIETRSTVGYSGGFMASARAASSDSSSYSNISSCHIKGYKIKAQNAGGMAGNVMNKPLHLTNSYIEDCIIESETTSGGFVSFVENSDAVSVLGYNLKTKNVQFTNPDSGQFIGNGNNKTIKLIGVAKYADADKLGDIKTTDIYQNGDNAFIVYTDYTEQSGADTTTSARASGFGAETNSDMPKAPFVTVNPREAMGSKEYITGDGAGQMSEALNGYTQYTSGTSTAVRIYADAIAESPSNRAYQPVTGLENYFASTEEEDTYKISSWNKEMTPISGVDDFTLLVVNSDDKDETTKLITKYIQLVTNTTKEYKEVTATDDYSIVINSCSYNSDTHKFEVVSENCGLRHYKNYYGSFYQMDVNNADSTKNNQFTLIDVRYKDPTDSSKVAYHLYVPVLTKKTIDVYFEATSIKGSTYQSELYKNRIASEISSGKNGGTNPSKIVESMDTWTTTYIRYRYPADQINELLKLNSDFKWNHDKQFVIARTFEDNIPEDTEMVLIDPNGGADRAYYAKASSFSKEGDRRIINLSTFTSGYGGEGNSFTESTIYSLINGKIVAGAGTYYSEVTSSTVGAVQFKMADDTTKYFMYNPENGTIDLKVEEDIYEDYYLSMFVPLQPGKANVVSVQPIATLSAVDESGAATSNRVIRATVQSELNATLILGDFFGHVINSFDVEPEDTVMTETNKTLTMKQTATVYIKNDREQAAYFKDQLMDDSIELYHSFNIILVKHDTAQAQTDIIQGGLTENTINATCKIGEGTPREVTPIREANYIQFTTGNIKSDLLASSGYSISITTEAEMTFPDYASEFPPNLNDAAGVGVQAFVRSSIAYREDELSYSRMTAKKGDTKFYYTKSQSNASLIFDAVDMLDEEQIGADTMNNSHLGVNGFYEYSNPLKAQARYNVADVVDFSNATQICYSIQLYRKTLTEDGVQYVTVDNIDDYLTDVTLTDTGGDTELSKNEAESKQNKYVYYGQIDHDKIETRDRLFTTDFSCNILNGSKFSKKEYANYRIEITAQLIGASNNLTTAYIVYTNAKINPNVILEP